MREIDSNEHIPVSAYAVCDADAKKNIMPKLPKNIQIGPVSDDDKYSIKMAEMMAQFGLNTRYLQGGISAWKWDLTESSSEGNISPIELKNGEIRVAMSTVYTVRRERT